MTPLTRKLPDKRLHDCKARGAEELNLTAISSLSTAQSVLPEQTYVRA